jgi:hypothetical protein
MTRLLFVAALGLPLLLAGAAGGSAQPRPPPEPPTEQPLPPPPKGPEAPPPGPPAKGAPAPPATAKCKLPGGGTRVLPLKQKQCRQRNHCSCAGPCPPCA